MTIDIHLFTNVIYYYVMNASFSQKNTRIVEMVHFLDMCSWYVYGVLVGYGQELWCTDLTYRGEMMY